MVVVRPFGGPDLRGVGAGQDQLHVAGVASPRGQQRVVRPGGVGVGIGGDAVPQGGGGMQQEQVPVAPGGQGGEHVEGAGGLGGGGGGGGGGEGGGGRGGGGAGAGPRRRAGAARARRRPAGARPGWR